MTQQFNGIYGGISNSDGTMVNTTVSRDIEAVQIILAMWTEDEAVFEGKSYQVHGAIKQPTGKGEISSSDILRLDALRFFAQEFIV